MKERLEENPQEEIVRDTLAGEAPDDAAEAPERTDPGTGGDTVNEAAASPEADAADAGPAAEDTKDAEAAEDAEDAESGPEDADIPENEPEDTEEPQAGDEGTEPPSGEGTGKPDEPGDPAAGKIGELTDRLKRLMAEFDNYRKRTEKEKASSFDAGAKRTIEKILPVLDSLERGLSSAKEEDADNPFYIGMDMIYKQLMKVLADLGVEPIEAEGKTFDPDFHNAVLQVDDEALESGTVAQELRKGYTFRGSVLRHSMVSVVS
ncbi:MAG: nucleotide exchange factor GrpE [Lachnospiraceae bacterium]|nr:nucleotide exchange factor GrpE [Lachnospiraceae bacterium]